MTVLGNIVAVTSIIAVVSLIQGLNASVQDAILNQAGADSFSVQQFPITFSDEEFEEVRYNPRITADDARAIRRYSPLVSAVMLECDGQRAGRLSRQDDRQRSIQGVTSEFSSFSTFNAERGRLMSPIEVERVASGRRDRLGHRRSAVRRRSIRSRRSSRSKASTSASSA